MVHTEKQVNVTFKILVYKLQLMYPKQSLKQITHENNFVCLKLVEKGTRSVKKNSNNFIKSNNNFILQEAFQLHKPSKAICLSNKISE